MNMKKLYNEKIESIDSEIDKLQREKIVLERLKGGAVKEKGIEKWIDYPFQSSSVLTKEFSAFARDFKKYLLQQIKTDFDLVYCGRGHFEISGFLKNKKNGRYIYFSTSDVRHFPDNWYNNILIRTAKNDKDYTGGNNDYCDFKGLKDKALKLSKI